MSAKNGLSVLTGFAVIGLATIPLVISADSLTWPCWKMAIILLAAIAVVSLFLQSYLQSQDDKKQDERERGRDEHLENMSRLLERLAGKEGLLADSSSQPAPKESPQLTPNDPRIYPEIRDESMNAGAWAQTVFALRNEGGEVAQKVLIEPLTLTTSTTSFGLVEAIRSKNSQDVVPDIERVSPLHRHDITEACMKEWDAAGVVAPTFSRPMRILYEDYKGRKFETKFDLVYFPIQDIVRQQHSTWPGRKKEILKITNLEIRPL